MAQEYNKSVSRTYESELLEYVIERNAIIYLPNADSKLFATILILNRFSEQLERSIKNGGKRAVFICRTVELARQHATQIRKNTNLRVGFYAGECKVCKWGHKRWNSEINAHQVLFGTAQIFLDIICLNFLKLSDLNLVIVDECQYAVKNHPINQFLRLFELFDQSSLPRVIGITRILIKDNVELDSVIQELHNLEATVRGNIMAVSFQDTFHRKACLFSSSPEETLVPYSQGPSKHALQWKITKLIEETCAIIDVWHFGSVVQKPTRGITSLRHSNKNIYLKAMFRDFLYQLHEFGIYAGCIAIVSLLTDFEAKLREVENSLRCKYIVLGNTCQYIRRILVKTIKARSDKIGNENGEQVDVIKQLSTPKLCTFLAFLKSKFVHKRRNDIRCLVFVERRYTAKCLFHILQKYLQHTPELQNAIYPQFTVGNNTIMHGIETTCGRKWNHKVIQEFHAKKFNLIICSSGLEEGIDIEDCNYVFVLDPIRSISSYSLTKGRAHSDNGIYAVFTPKLDRTKVAEKLAKYRNIHTIIKKYLMARTLDITGPKWEDLTGHFFDTVQSLDMPSGAILRPSAALRYLNEYCYMAISEGATSSVMPMYSVVPVAPGKYIATVKLSIKAPYDEVIHGEPMQSKHMAKISASIHACKRLFGHGGIMDQLLSITK